MTLNERSSRPLPVLVLVLVLSVLASLTSCGESAAPSASAPQTPSTTPTVSAAAEPEIKLVHGLDNAGATTRRRPLGPLESYQAVDATGDREFVGLEVERQRAALRNIYWSRAPFDAAAMGADVFAEIALEKDSFRRADLAASRHAELETLHRAAAAYRRVAVLDSKGGGINVLPYNAKSQTFRVNFNNSGVKMIAFDKGTGHHASWDLTLIGLNLSPGADGAVRHQLDFRPATEADARRIEAEVAGEARGVGAAHLPVLFYGEVIHATSEGFQSFATVRVDGVAVLARDANSVLFRFDRQALGDLIYLDFVMASRLGAR